MFRISFYMFPYKVPKDIIHAIIYFFQRQFSQYLWKCSFEDFFLHCLWRDVYSLKQDSEKTLSIDVSQN